MKMDMDSTMQYLEQVRQSERYKAIAPLCPENAEHMQKLYLGGVLATLVETGTISQETKQQIIYRDFKYALQK